jgi:hypothetical protein
LATTTTVGAVSILRSAARLPSPVRVIPLATGDGGSNGDVVAIPTEKGLV